MANSGTPPRSAKIGQALGVTHPTAQSYVRTLERAFMLRVLPPLEANLKKPAGQDPESLPARCRPAPHPPAAGDRQRSARPSGLWQFLGRLRPRTGAGRVGWSLGGIFLPHQRRQRVRPGAATWPPAPRHRVQGPSAPELTPDFHRALEYLRPETTWVVAPVREAYPVGKEITVTPLPALLDQLSRMKA